MSIKTILVPLGGADAVEPILDAAFAVAHRFGAHVVGLHVRPDPREMLPYATLGLARSMTQSIIQASDSSSRETAARLRQKFERRCAEDNVPFVEPVTPDGASADWHEEVGRESSAVALYGRLADLIVLPRQAKEAPAPATLEAALMTSGRPVLLVPPRRPRTTVGDTVAIAWNGSAQAARAVASAMPFLATAKTVSVLSTPGGAEPKLSAADLASYLARHDVGASTHTFEGESRVGRTLLAEAEKQGADLLVMGAYGRSRERELILGGVTRRVLATAELPVFMAH